MALRFVLDKSLFTRYLFETMSENETHRILAHLVPIFAFYLHLFQQTSK